MGWTLTFTVTTSNLLKYCIKEKLAGGYFLKGRSEVVFLKKQSPRQWWRASGLSKVGQDGDGEEERRKTAKCQDLAPFPEAGGSAFRSLGNPAINEDKWLYGASRQNFLKSAYWKKLPWENWAKKMYLVFPFTFPDAEKGMYRTHSGSHLSKY